MMKKERNLTKAEIQALNIPNIMWRKFSDEPDCNKMIIIKDEDDYWTSYVKMVEIKGHKKIKVANMVQRDNTSFWVVMEWFDFCVWAYAT